MLSNLCAFIENTLLEEIPLIDQLRRIRDSLTKHLSNIEFKMECINYLISSIESSQLNQVGWSEPTIFYHEKLKFSIRLIIWPAFYENNPHQHKTWSITGVLYNALNVKTYQLINSMQLKKERSILASATEVGYLLPGCIHNINNPTHQLSASLHIFNNIDVKNPEENAIWYPAPRKFNMSKGALERALQVCLEIASESASQISLTIIKRIFDIAPISIKLNAIKSMYALDKNYGRKCFEELEKEF